MVAGGYSEEDCACVFSVEVPSRSKPKGTTEIAEASGSDEPSPTRYIHVIPQPSATGALEPIRELATPLADPVFATCTGKCESLRKHPFFFFQEVLTAHVLAKSQASGALKNPSSMYISVELS